LALSKDLAILQSIPKLAPVVTASLYDCNASCALPPKVDLALPPRMRSALTR
jgi:hypothetical protein